MEIEVYGTYQAVTELKLREKSVVVIDLLRATSTMVEAIYNGAKNIFPVCDVEEAMNLYRMHQDQSVLAGEREGLPIEGFDLGNSPQVFTREIVENKSVILTTTNGTMALHAVRNSETILLGCLRNRQATANRLVEIGQNIAFVCAGTDGRFSGDDYYCAGAIIEAVVQQVDVIHLSDAAQVAKLYYREVGQDSSIIRETMHYKKMLSLGLEEDLAFCFEEDIYDCVPQMINSIVEPS